MASFGILSKVPFVLGILLLSHFEPSAFAGRGQRRKRIQGSHVGRCKDGMFDDRRQGGENGTLNCRPCSQCLAGYGVTRLCTLHDDTECSPCPIHQYSATNSSLDGCIACQACGKHHVEEKACTPKSDSVCVANCPKGHFYSPVDENCLPCSPCGDRDGRTSERIERPECADIAPNLRCWPPKEYEIPDPRATGDIDNEASSQPSDDPARPTPSQHPRRVVGNSNHDMDDATARIYTIVLLTLFLVSSLCLLVSVVAIVCLCRLLKITGSFRSHGTKKGGYQSISKRTSELLVKNTTLV